eukprot:1574444-Heterocapsa_arctica.AAC.1
MASQDASLSLKERPPGSPEEHQRKVPLRERRGGRGVGGLDLPVVHQRYHRRDRDRPSAGEGLSGTA